ncbi:hypothetical protein FQN57_000970 [Myotisia sp. PD_48]|nr:hypothetical protein FQN57_000970 [Myotisia sp. PD_48]
MSDRPDRPPVWVRGGVPYYYHPGTGQQIPPPISATEAMRKASISSASSSPSSPSSPSDRRASSVSSDSSMGSTFSPPSPAAPSTRPVHTGLFSFLSPSPEARSTAASPVTSLSPHGGYYPGSRGSKEGQRQFSSLLGQKRDSKDPTFTSRRQSWSEQHVGSDPEQKRFMYRWWNK